MLFFSFKLTKTVLRWSLHSTGRRQIMKFICKYIYVFIYIKSSSYVLKKIFKNVTQNAMSADLVDKVLPCTQTLAFTFPPLFFSTLHLLKHFKKICLFYLSSIFFQWSPSLMKGEVFNCLVHSLFSIAPNSACFVYNKCTIKICWINELFSRRYLKFQVWDI